MKQKQLGFTGNGKSLKKEYLCRGPKLKPDNKGQNTRSREMKKTP